ncbi:serine hydrolase domain-containing protein [Actinoplanes sp. NPDC051851]|uniref:serine hydrolase domain-containing protein n=1 Tax=Actinoplanes sp. NPDC051851 TaxID=3154753 RepID=UPI003430E286
MALEELTGPVHGSAAPWLGAIVTELSGYAARDPLLAFQAAAYADGELILDVRSGLGEDALLVPYSVSKNIIGVSVGLLIERGLLDLDAPVADVWPEFAAAGKARVTVRQLLSHQAGLPDASPVLSWDELLDHHRAAERLAATRPLWHPGSAFGYHGITIGNLGDELVFRVTGQTLHEFYESQIRKPVDADAYLGLPSSLDHSLVPLLPMAPPLGERPPMPDHPLMATVFGPRPGEQVDLAGSERSWRFGHAAGSAVISARGIAGVLAHAVTGVDGGAPLLSADTVAQIGQQQVRGYDEVLDQQDRAHAIVFQKPSKQLAWGGPRSFGHDGAAGAVACVDPDTGVAFGWTVRRGPWPGGGDPRGIALARKIGAAVTASAATASSATASAATASAATGR